LNHGRYTDDTKTKTTMEKKKSVIGKIRTVRLVITGFVLVQSLAQDANLL
jgi:hypothetical protein